MTGLQFGVTGDTTGGYSDGPFSFYKWLLTSARVLLHSSATAGTRRVQIGLGPGPGQGVILLDTGAFVTTNSTAAADGGPASVGEGAGTAHTTWSGTVRVSPQDTLWLKFTLIAGDTVDWWIFGEEQLASEDA